MPRTGVIFQVLCLSGADGRPDLSTLRAFKLSPGIGLCMRPGVWHTTRAENATCLMLTVSPVVPALASNFDIGAGGQVTITVPEVKTGNNWAVACE